MTRRLSRLVTAGLACGGLAMTSVAVVACGDPEPAPALAPDVALWVQSDLTPGVELSSLEVSWGPEDGGRDGVARFDFAPGDDLESAPRELLRIARPSADEPPVLVRVAAASRSGDTSALWRATLPPEVERLDARLFRSCQDTRCEAGTRCLAGRCVPPDCLRGDEASCPPAQCVDDEDCGASDPVCTLAGRCDAGACFARVIGSRCGPGHDCAPRLGCVP
ncbi:MAG: hypothetical protein AAF447_27530, partial [Myxococcota bacterium]